MSRMIGPGIFLSEGEPDSTCQLCGKVDECRPYGPNGENICYPCAMKDEEAVKRKFLERLGNPQTIVLVDQGQN